MSDTITFRQLESAMSDHDEDKFGDSSLDEWYKSIRNTPITDFGDGDLSRACRQQLYLNHVVPIAVERLKSQPLAGDMYDGELLVAMKSISIDYWRTDQESARQLFAIAQEAKLLVDEDIADDVDELVGRLVL